MLHSCFAKWAIIAEQFDITLLYFSSELKCDQETMHINCPLDSIVDVISAFYGRLDLTTCQHKYMKSTSCSLPGATDTVRMICQDKTTCDVETSSFADPCYGTYKYMNVTYECRRKSSNMHSFSNISSDYFSCYIIYIYVD